MAQGGTLLLDFGPMPDGRVQGEFVSRLRVMGDWLRRNGASTYGAERDPYDSVIALRLAPVGVGASWIRGPRSNRSRLGRWRGPAGNEPPSR